MAIIVIQFMPLKNHPILLPMQFHKISFSVELISLTLNVFHYLDFTASPNNFQVEQVCIPESKHIRNKVTDHEWMTGDATHKNSDLALL